MNMPAMMMAIVPSLAAAEAQPNALTPAEKAAGWQLLFDGRSPSAWRAFGKDSFPADLWSVEDECLRIHASDHEDGTDIITREQFGDFELSLEFKTAPGGNSGIIYRASEQHNYPWKSGPEFQILDDHGAGESAASNRSAGAIYDMYAPSAEKALKPAGEFNHARIRLRRNQIEHWLNGVKVLTCDVGSDDWNARVAASKFIKYPGFGTVKRGHIGLQDHQSDVWFRSIKVRDLDARMPGEVALFDGSSLQQWTFFAENDAPIQSAWRIEDGILICAGQPIGYMRTTDDFTNFVLKLEWRFNPVTKKAGNSGVLVRMQMPDKVWPRSVEAQLHSENAGDFWNIESFQMSADPERTRGRNTRKLRMAERPVGEWNEYEIIVHRGDVRLIVNGDEVNHAWDVEEIPGKICLQSEGAEIHFRNIRVAEIKH